MSHQSIITTALLVLSSLWLTGQTRAATPPAAPAPRLDSINEIVAVFNSPDPAMRRRALDALKQRMQTARGLTELRGPILTQIADTGRHVEIVELCQDLAVATSGDTHNLEAVLKMKIKSLLALGRNDEALADAKRLFNVSSMAGTSDAILAVAQCLNAVSPTDPAPFNKFREEQMAGAATQPAFNTAPDKARKCSVLQGIKLDPKPYADTAKRITAEDAASLMAKGNLLLMADDPAGARVVFERLYSLSSSDLPEASEAIARCMKAEDGTIGRANTWVLSIRPRSGR